MDKIKILILLIIAFTLNSCDLDQVESRFVNYEQASSADFLDKGWIPETLIMESMTNIYVRNNLDLNTVIFSFNVSSEDIDSIQLKLSETDITFEKPRRIKVTKAWIKEVNSIKQRYFLKDNQLDTVFISIDNKNNILYGWSN